MLSLKTVIEGVVEHGRRVVLQATRPGVNPTRYINNNNCLKLSEAQSKKIIGRPQPKGVNSRQQHQVTETLGSSQSLVSARGSIVNLLRPVTSRFVQGLVRRVSSPFWTEARRKSAKRLFGETAPYFALVGVTLVSGPERGLLTAQDELEAICGDIREAISRAGWIHNPDFWKGSEVLSEEGNAKIEKGFSLSDFTLGSSINKGCNAVVYSAKWNGGPSKPKEDNDGNGITPVAGSEASNESPKLVESLENLLSSQSFLSLESLQNKRKNSEYSEIESTEFGETESKREETLASEFNEELLSPDSSSTDEEYYEFKSEGATATSEEYLNLSNCYSLTSIKDDTFTSQSSLESVLKQGNSVSFSEDLNLLLSNGSFQHRPEPGVLKRKKVKFKEEYKSQEELCEEKLKEDKPLCNEQMTSIDEYPLAVKMMFNYEAESNAPAILTAMYKEMLPARSVQLDDVSNLWKQRLLQTTTRLPPHVNVVDMPCVFVDRIPHLSDGLSLYPDALPKRINPSGFGRNMSLFCVMKRYDCTLSEYLKEKKPSVRVSLLLLTQLLEAIHHINKYGVAHRDLKSDNILLCLSEGFDSPHLVLSDFGCSLADPNLRVAFPSFEADPRVGNAALMAPEVKSLSPGLLTSVNYSKSDLWAAGTIAYEVFGLENPFSPRFRGSSPEEDGFHAKNSSMLDSATYKEQSVPKLPKSIPMEIRILIHDMLRRNPRQRPSPTVAATVCQLSLWGPRKWLNRHSLGMPSHREVMQWLLCLSTKVLCEAGTTSSSNPSKDSSENGISDRKGGKLEYEVVSTFLRRVQYSDIIQALKWIRAF